MKILTTTQRDDAWIHARLGYLTSSRAADMLATLKSKGEAAGRRNLRVQLVLERLTGVSHENGYLSKDMQYGMDREVDAFAAYEVETGLIAMPCGFVAHDELLAGCSPDGVIGNFEGLLEVKCRKSANHLEFLKSRRIPLEAQQQMLHQLWITGATWCDYVSFDDRFPSGTQLIVGRFAPHDGEIPVYEEAARAFLHEVDEELTQLAARVLA